MVTKLSMLDVCEIPGNTTLILIKVSDLLDVEIVSGSFTVINFYGLR